MLTFGIIMLLTPFVIPVSIGITVYKTIKTGVNQDYFQKYGHQLTALAICCPIIVLIAFVISRSPLN